MKKFLYLDIDGVLAVGYNNPKTTMWGNIEKWNAKCVKVLNEILTITDADIVVSSDWKHHFDLDTLAEIFMWQGVSKIPMDVTPYIKGATMQQLDEFRAKEILMHVEQHRPDKWVAVDDLKMMPWLEEEHFVETPRWMEGIKQSGVKEKIINLLQ
jgi:hypothetical protein